MAISVRHECTFYRTQDGAEIDLLLETPQGVLACEIKWGTHTTGSEARALAALELDCPIFKKVVLCPSKEVRAVAPGILQQHWASLELTS